MESRKNKSTHINSAVFIDENKNQLQLIDVLENKKYMNLYKTACLHYQFVLDEINDSGVYLVLDLSSLDYPPTYRLAHDSGELPQNLKDLY